ncbi:hypothetical protein E2C01_003100 [Portunus trituberculatus]|uniref:Uncharacterized protein n=1 Tax=Portunus trituberculatus TaxID=210409 RepID=A0A5B7CPA7_PORTR|nr:hypothetical protein [Portunus trituberculatus]
MLRDSALWGRLDEGRGRCLEGQLMVCLQRSDSAASSLDIRFMTNEWKGEQRRWSSEETQRAGNHKCSQHARLLSGGDRHVACKGQRDARYALALMIISLMVRKLFSWAALRLATAGVSSGSGLPLRFTFFSFCFIRVVFPHALSAGEAARLIPGPRVSPATGENRSWVQQRGAGVQGDGSVKGAIDSLRSSLIVALKLSKTFFISTTMQEIMYHRPPHLLQEEGEGERRRGAQKRGAAASEGHFAASRLQISMLALVFYSAAIFRIPVVNATPDCFTAAPQ